MKRKASPDVIRKWLKQLESSYQLEVSTLHVMLAIDEKKLSQVRERDDKLVARMTIKPDNAMSANEANCQFKILSRSFLVDFFFVAGKTFARLFRCTVILLLEKEARRNSSLGLQTSFSSGHDGKASLILSLRVCLLLAA
jgi:hypothetical protein